MHYNSNWETSSPPWPGSHLLPNFGHLAWNLVDPTTGKPGMSGFAAE